MFRMGHHIVPKLLDCLY